MLNASLSVPAVNLQDGVLLTWTGYDGSFHEEEIESLPLAQRRAVMIEEHGGHSITIADVDDDV